MCDKDLIKCDKLKKVDVVLKVPTRTCIAVANLRKKYNDKDITLEKWLNDPDNTYIGRHGRIFINKVIFHYKSSIWENPFTVKKYGLDESLDLYEKYITEKIENDPDNFNIRKLSCKSLGCFCKEGDRCHADILIQKFNKL